MSSILELLRGHEVRHFDCGDVVVRQGESTGQLFFLIEGAVEVLKENSIESLKARKIDCIRGA